VFFKNNASVNGGNIANRVIARSAKRDEAIFYRLKDCFAPCGRSQWHKYCSSL